eukprot:4707866-Pyramimonas_sp.AAC.2
MEVVWKPHPPCSQSGGLTALSLAGASRSPPAACQGLMAGNPWGPRKAPWPCPCRRRQLRRQKHAPSPTAGDARWRSCGCAMGPR